MKSRVVVAITLVAGLEIGCATDAREAVDESICGPLPPSKTCSVRMCISGDPSWTYAPFPEGARCGSDGICDGIGRCVEAPSRALRVAQWISTLPRLRGLGSITHRGGAIETVTSAPLAIPPHGAQ